MARIEQGDAQTQQFSDAIRGRKVVEHGLGYRSGETQTQSDADRQDGDRQNPADHRDQAHGKAGKEQRSDQHLPRGEVPGQPRQSNPDHHGCNGKSTDDHADGGCPQADLRAIKRNQENNDAPGA